MKILATLASLATPWILTLALLGCTTVHPSKGVWAFTTGKTCVFTDSESFVVKSDGMPINLAEIYDLARQRLMGLLGFAAEAKVPHADFDEVCEGVFE